MRTQFGHYTRYLFRHAELGCSATPHPCAFAWDCPVGTSSCGPASLKGPESSSGRRICFGRSMIEMLGVLAIIGVLSIGGIALYRRAVNNHQANVILDDANRLAFVITEKGGFAPNDNITNVEFNQTSTYSMVPFVGQKSGQYGIMVENVPKGVCEPLVDKAHIDYKVRVAAYGAIEYLDQDTSTGLVYDSFHKDICVNDMNDVILYFGDTSAQCNKPEEGQDGNPCNSNADCCGGSFCWYPNDSSDAGIGKCEKMIGAEFSADTRVMENGKVWTRSVGTMNFDSAQNWCDAQQLKMASREDIGCKDVINNQKCEGSAFLDAVKKDNTWRTYYSHWLETHERFSTVAYRIVFNSWYIFNDSKNNLRFALCH